VPWYMTPCNSVDKWSYKHFGGTGFLHLQSTRICPEDGGSTFLRNVGIKLLRNTEIFIVSSVRISYLKCQSILPSFFSRIFLLSLFAFNSNLVFLLYDSS
jgi:hypothetical protein